MTLRKRLRLLWAALTQDWRESRCDCGETQWTQGIVWSDPEICVTCETQSFDAWAASYEARHGKGAA